MSSRKRMTSYRPWGSLEDGAIEFESLTTERLEGAMEVIRQDFFTGENVCIAVKLQEEPGAAAELEQLCFNAIKDGVSVVAIDVMAGEVVGVALNKIQIPQHHGEKGSFEIFSERCKHKSSKALVDFMINVDSRVNLFSHFNVDCILELMFVATKKTHRRRRIGELLTAASTEVARELSRGKDVKIPVEIDGDDTITNAERIPSLVSMIATSNYTKKIADRAGFVTLEEIKFNEFAFAGKKYSERISQEHKYCWLVARRLPIARNH